MSRITLTFGAFHLDGFELLRSGLRWAVADGAVCGEGDVLAYCSIEVRPRAASDAPPPFADEARDLQMALLAPCAGRLRQHAGMAPGGFRDFHMLSRWQDEPFATLEAAPTASPASAEARHLLVAGRRMSQAAEVRSGLLTGWHSRVRVSRVGPGPPGTLVAAGICDLDHTLRGPGHAFVEFVRQASCPAQLVAVPDTCLVSAAPVLLEQLQRTPGQTDEIAADMLRHLAQDPAASPADLLFCGALLQSLSASPLAERPPVLTRTGVMPGQAPEALLLSVRSEEAMLLRHRSLGYAVAVHRYRLEDAGPATRHWLRTQFEVVRRSMDEVHADYRALLGALRMRFPKMQVLIANGLAAGGLEDLHSYAGHVGPLEATFTSARSRALNLMLVDLARSHGIAIVDVDALAAQHGALEHLTDGLHGDGFIEAAVRAEILDILRARAVRGFADPPDERPAPLPSAAVRGSAGSLPVHACIIGWPGANEAAAAIAAQLQGHAEQVTVVYSTRDGRALQGAGEWIRLDDDCFFGPKCAAALARHRDGVMLQIQADASCDDWPGLLARCREVHERLPEVGVWSAEVSYTPWPTPVGSLLATSDPFLTVVAATDGIVWSLAPPIVERLQALDGRGNNLGWGFDVAAIAHAFSRGMVAVRDARVFVRHPHSRSYSTAEAERQMHAFLQQCTMQEKALISMMWTYLAFRSPPRP